jgi:hypothetical protein
MNERKTCVTIFKFFNPFVVNSSAAEHCSRIVPKVFDGLPPLIHLSTTKNRITERFSSLVQTESWAVVINGKAETM